MKTAVICYSLTGNNDKLARHIASALSAEFIKITEKRKRTAGAIARDMLLGLAPKTEPAAAAFESYDLSVFVGPVWMGRAASPFRTYFKRLKARPRKYAYVSLSGGALNTNPGLAGDLKKRTGARPAALVDLHIADLLTDIPKPTMKDTGRYRLDDVTAIKLAAEAVGTLRKALGEELKQ